MANFNQINESFNKKFESLLYEENCNSSKSKKQLKESDDIRHYSDMLFDMIEEGLVDAESIAKDLIYWCSEDDIEHYMRVNGYLDYEDDEEYDESLKEGTHCSSRNKKDASAQKKAKSLKESFVFLNNIDKDILDGSNDKNALKLMTNNSIKCSKSAINNLKFLLKQGHDASLCLGQLKKKDEDASNVISHVWVKSGDDIIQTHVPANLDFDVWEPYCIKEIKFNPSDLDDVENFHDKILSALNESSTNESLHEDNGDKPVVKLSELASVNPRYSKISDDVTIKLDSVNPEIKVKNGKTLKFSDDGKQGWSRTKVTVPTKDGKTTSIYKDLIKDDIRAFLNSNYLSEAKKQFDTEHGAKAFNPEKDEAFKFFKEKEKQGNAEVTNLTDSGFDVKYYVLLDPSKNPYPWSYEELEFHVLFTEDEIEGEKVYYVYNDDDGIDEGGEYTLSEFKRDLAGYQE